MGPSEEPPPSFVQLLEEHPQLEAEDPQTQFNVLQSAGDEVVRTLKYAREHSMVSPLSDVRDDLEAQCEYSIPINDDEEPMHVFLLSRFSARQPLSGVYELAIKNLKCLSDNMLVLNFVLLDEDKEGANSTISTVQISCRLKERSIRVCYRPDTASNPFLFQALVGEMEGEEGDGQEKKLVSKWVDVKDEELRRLFLAQVFGRLQDVFPKLHKWQETHVECLARRRREEGSVMEKLLESHAAQVRAVTAELKGDFSC